MVVQSKNGVPTAVRTEGEDTIGNEAAAEIDLQLYAQRRVVDSYRCPGYT